MRTSKLVICIENSDYPASLEKRKIYELLPDAEAEQLGQFRIVDESGEDYLYPSSLFIDAKLPKSVQAAVIEAA
jgi:hypothetical protein